MEQVLVDLKSETWGVRDCVRAVLENELIGPVHVRRSPLVLDSEERIRSGTVDQRGPDSKVAVVEVVRLGTTGPLPYGRRTGYKSRFLGGFSLRQYRPPEQR